ncbi:hypothetical protein AWB69_01460 [Caballeronia udeis]|uniref:Uncharacterized protein n=2 Tax=Caballeronia udeis TaxID=1232866 RepID=A0A158FR92_9BURK|nr:hypothetical protein AWB69_01460 [Caballeronia udeis]
MRMSFLKRGQLYVHYMTLRTAPNAPTAPMLLQARANALPRLWPSVRPSATYLLFLLRWLRYLLPACCGLPLAALPAPAQAHPHVWINYSMVAQTQGTLLVAMQQTWIFSKGFPFSLVGDFSNMPKSGPLNADYTATFKAQAFSLLKSSDYFNHVFVDGKAVAVAEARNFSVSIEQGHVVYRFLLPLVKPVDFKRERVTLGVWDDTFFVDFESAAQPALTLGAGSPRNCKATAFEDHDHPIFGGTILPQASRLSC